MQIIKIEIRIQNGKECTHTQPPPNLISQERYESPKGFEYLFNKNSKTS